MSELQAREAEAADRELSIEPERYEFFETAPYHFDVDRREFFKCVGAGIVVCLLARSAPAQRRRRGGRGRGRDLPKQLRAWLHLDEKGKVTVYTGKAEVGQNIRTSLSQMVAEELCVPIESIELVMADTDRTPYDAGTFGSMTTRSMAPQLQKVAATARELLLELAAKKFSVERDSLAAVHGKISHAATLQSVTYGELAKDLRLTKSVEADPKIARPNEWQVAGTSVTKVEGAAIVSGKHQYASDVRRPGMLFGKVLRKPVPNATMNSVAAGEAKKIEGVTVVQDGDFVGVTAPSSTLAQRAIDAIQVDWKPSADTGTDLFEQLKKLVQDEGEAGRRSVEESGSIESGMAAADHQLKSTYKISYIAHAPLEPRAAVAEWSEGKLTVWTGTQRPFGVREELMRAFGLESDKVRVIVPDMGSGYGGKHTGEAAVEAARLAKSAGKPVKLVWTREEEFTAAYFRPAGVIEILSGVTKDGKITAWDFHNYNSGSSAIRPLYDIPNIRTEFHSSDAPLRQGSYRALAATANHFARESHIDELAHAVQKDPLEMRLINLNFSRLRDVLAAAAKQFRWGEEKSSPERGFGIAGGSEKGSYVATCAEVAIDRSSGQVKVVRLVTAFECGAILNPDHLKNQVEGAVIMGLGGALFEAIELDGNRVKNPKFSSYRVPRFSDVPVMETVLLNRKELPSAGAGETPIVAVAPAIGNAIFQATGIRCTMMPMAPSGLKLT